MIHDNRGDGFVQKIVLIVLVIACAPAFVAIYRNIKNRGDQAAADIEAMDLSFGE